MLSSGIAPGKNHCNTGCQIHITWQTYMHACTEVEYLKYKATLVLNLSVRILVDSDQSHQSDFFRLKTCHSCFDYGTNVITPWKQSTGLLEILLFLLSYTLKLPIKLLRAPHENSVWEN